jgi:hypothetical protein
MGIICIWLRFDIFILSAFNYPFLTLQTRFRLSSEVAKPPQAKFPCLPMSNTTLLLALIVFNCDEFLESIASARVMSCDEFSSVYLDNYLYYAKLVK